MSTSQTSKAALEGLRQAEWLASSTAVQKPKVSAALHELYGSTQGDAADNPAPADWNVVQDSNIVLLNRSAGNLRQADQAHRENLVVLKKLRRRRQRMVAGFKGRIRDERKSFGGTYTEEALADLRLDAPPARTYLAIREQLLEFRERLQDPATPDKLPDPLPGHLTIELQPIADAIGDQIEAYDNLMTEIREQRKRADESLLAKQQAIKDNRRTIVNVGRVQEGYYRLVGLDDLADRIRVATRPRRKPKPEETPESEEPESEEPESPEPESPEPESPEPESPEPESPATESPEPAPTGEPSPPATASDPPSSPQEAP